MLALLLIGCSSWVEKSSCNLDVYGWSDDLLTHILNGDGSGAFDYDPADIPRQQIVGDYKPGSGNFSYEVEYAGEYWLQSEEVEGYGTVYHNGDLDLRYEVTYTDRLDEEWTRSFDLEREGCAVTLQSWEGERDLEENPDATIFVRQGAYDEATAFHWEAEDDNYDYAGGNRQNLSSTVSIEAKDGSYSSFSSTVPEGTSTETWEGACYQDSGDYFCAGTTDTAFNGDVEQAYTVELDGDLYAEMEWTYFYEGGAEGEVVYYEGNDEITCEYEIDEDDNCTLSCDDGTDGAC